MGAININSLSKHIDELKMFICDNSIDVLAVNETKLDCSIPDTVVIFELDSLDIETLSVEI